MAKKFTAILRDMEAADNRRRREEMRRGREQERRRKATQRLLGHLEAAKEAAAYEAEVDTLRSLHRECAPRQDWAAVKASGPPDEPQPCNQHELEAQAALDGFKPGLADKLARRVDRKRSGLESALEEARRRDQADYVTAMQEYETQYEEWQAQRELATRILSGDLTAYLEAVQSSGHLDFLREVGVSADMRQLTVTAVVADVYVDKEDIVPSETKSVLQSGKLSVKSMPKATFYSLYQDYVCGAVCRVARELFSLLPIEMAVLTAVTDTLNTQTGHLEELPILSVAIPRDTIERLNFENLDPSDSMANFVNNLKFTKTKGFFPTERIDADRFIQDSPDDAGK